MGIYVTGRSNANFLIIGMSGFVEYLGHQGADMKKPTFLHFFSRKMALGAMFFKQETLKWSYLNWLGPYK